MASKFRNKPCVIDGRRFDSQAEGRRYLDLKTLERAGEISGLEMQPRYKLFSEGRLVCTYVADFAYDERGKKVAEDVKGVETPAFKIKAKLFRALHPEIDLRVVRA